MWGRTQHSTLPACATASCVLCPAAGRTPANPLSQHQAGDGVLTAHPACVVSPNYTHAPKPGPPAGTLTVGDVEVVTMFAIDSATFSTSAAQSLTHKYDLKQRKGALHCVRAWAAKGYQPIYLSGRQVRTAA